MFDPVTLHTQSKRSPLVSDPTQMSHDRHFSSPDCSANGTVPICGGFIVMEEWINRSCHVKQV